MKVLEHLKSLAEPSYAKFISKLIPTISSESIIGVRLPLLRKTIKNTLDDQDKQRLLCNLPHKYHEENLLHALIINDIKDYNKCLEALKTFLPFINNWAVCDSLTPKTFKKHSDRLLQEIPSFLKSKNAYACRLGIKFLMNFYLDEEFDDKYLTWVAEITNDEYYVKMMQSWFFATALAKQWSKTISYFQTGKLNVWVHQKSIQKAIESYRISPEQKAYLRTLR